MNNTTRKAHTIVPITTTSPATTSAIEITPSVTAVDHHPTPDNTDNNHGDNDHRGKSSTTATTMDYNNSLTIDNPYLNVLSLIDITYPPLICSTCDRIATSDIENRYHHHITHYNNRRRRYPCLHAHCELSFNSRTALRFHLGRSHLVKQASLKHIRPEPPFMHYRLMPPLGSFTPTAKKRTALYHNNQCYQHHHHATTKITSIAPQEEEKQQQSQSQKKTSLSLSLSSSSTTTTTSSTNRSSLSFKIHTAKTFAATTLFPVPPSPPLQPLSSSSSPPPPPNSTSSPPTNNTNTNIPRLSPTSEALINSVYHPLHCPCCHEHFPRKINVIKHVAEMHQDQEPYACVYDNCTERKCYPTRDGLVYHTVRVHDSSNNNEMDIDENNNEWIKSSPPSPPEKSQEEHHQQQENGSLSEEGREKQLVKTTKRKRSKSMSTKRPDVRWAIHR